MRSTKTRDTQKPAHTITNIQTELKARIPSLYGPELGRAFVHHIIKDVNVSIQGKSKYAKI